MAMKASRLRSLAISAIDAVPNGCALTRADFVSAAILTCAEAAGVDITTAGLLEGGTTPLIAALRLSFLGAARVLLDAGADVDRLSRDGLTWPLFASAQFDSDAGIPWLLEHGASLAIANRPGHTVAHLLSAAAGADSAAAVAEFWSGWLRRVVRAEPTLLEARDAEGFTLLVLAASAGCEAGVATLLGLGADIGAREANGRTALVYACAASSLPALRRLIAASAARAPALLPGSWQAQQAAYAATRAALVSDRGCGMCVLVCGGLNHGNCADGLDVLRAVLAAGVREAVTENDRSLGTLAVAWVGASWRWRQLRERWPRVDDPAGAACCRRGRAGQGRGRPIPDPARSS
jgi:hypothetical protein